MNLDIKEFNYLLPEERIAIYPLVKRDVSKLLVYKQSWITDDKFSNICYHLPEKSILFTNNTRVIHARLKFQKSTGANIEIFCLSPADPSDYQLSFSKTKTCTWHCIVGNLKKWKSEILELAVQIDGLKTILYAERMGSENDTELIRFSWADDIGFGIILENVGNIPIPPYLNRNSENIDNERYQTVYSKFDGSVAAPTAGLHFTPEVFDQLRKNNILQAEITLHVGAGTFQPVKSENAMDHKMHQELFSVDLNTIKLLAANSEPVIATGTTTLRTLESLFWLAVKSLSQNRLVNQLEQWDNHLYTSNLSKKEIFSELLILMQKEQKDKLVANTGIMIIPGYQFKVADALITNFHQPQSTLLLLVSAFIGSDWKKVYKHALKQDYRFLSYGDSSLLWK
jgi:S-adenosylmethionine:tRNA ribosyltransferase-isomerase